MAAPINTPLNVDMWHLSIDDLLAPLPEVSRLGGSGPFVINLSVSTAPISLPATRIAGQQAHVYQIQRVEDGRTRYRLRLGPFADEDTANSILAVVREIYPSALTATAAADDLRAIAPMQAKLDAQRPPAVVAAMQPAAHPAASIQTAARPAAPISPAPMPPLRVPPTLTVSVPILTPPVHPSPAHSVSAPLPVPPNSPPPAQLVTALVPEPPLRSSPAQLVSAPVAIPPSRPLPMQSASAPIAEPSVRPLPAQSVSAPVPQPVERLSEPLASLESTQTVRLLTALELEDDEVLRWYVIQLSLAEQAFDPDTVPNLDIFSVYRLYSVATIDQGQIMHSLRLGFFSEEVAAAAVASYLADYYDKPTVKRVSVDERERFSAQVVEARKDVGATGRHAVIEITNELVVRKNRITGPARRA